MNGDNVMFVSESTGNHRICCRLRCRSAALSGLILAILSAPLTAQTLTGPFSPANNWWIHPVLGTPGINRDATNIFIDRDGDGINETTYNIPNLGVQAFPINIVLSPTREIMMAFGGSCPGGGTPVYFFDTTTPPNLTVIDNACVQNNIGDIGFYDTFLCAQTGIGGLGLDCPTMPDSPQRIAYVRDANSQGRNQVYWFDLVNGVHRTTFPGFNRGFPFHRIDMSPYGDVAFVQHGATGSSPPSSDYTLVDLCPGPAFGTALSSNVGGAIFDLPATDVATAEMMQSGANFFIRVSHSALSGGSDDFAFTPCGGGGGGNDTGACCFSNGTCSDETLVDCDAAGGSWLGPGSDCTECELPGACCFTTSCISNLTESECDALPGGMWLGALSTCATCDVLDLDITKSASAPTVQEGATLQYTLNYDNVGDVDAMNPVITDVIPSGSTYVSSSNGGTYNNATRTVTWNLPGTLVSGESGSVTLVIRANCGSTNLVNSTYRIMANGITFFGSPVVQTPVTAAGAGPVSIAISSVPDRDPLQRGDLVTHTVTLTEQAGVGRNNLSFTTSLGQNVDFDSVIDEGGGTASLNNTLLNWTGPLGANASIDVVFTTRVRDCTSGSPATTQLNFGNPVQIRNSCGLSLGSANPPSPIEIVQPMRAQMIAQPPIGPPQFNTIGQSATQVARAGDTLDLKLTLINQLAGGVPSASATFVLPAGYTPAMIPPFVAPSDPGAAYNAATRTVSWSGAVSGNSSVEVTVRVTHSDPDECAVSTVVGGMTGSCNDIFYVHTMLFVSEPPAESHLLGLFANQGGAAELWSFRPGVDFLREPFLCIGHEVLWGLTCTPDGDIWVLGLPMFRINPETLDFRIFPDDLAETFGIAPFGDLFSAAYDPSDGTMIMAGTNQGAGAGQLFIVRYDEVADSHTMIFDGTTVMPQLRHSLFTRVMIDPDGRIACLAFETGQPLKIVRIDPSDPMNYQSFNLVNAPSPSSMALASDGNYLVANLGFASDPLSIVHVDRNTGVETVLVADLKTLLPGSEYIGPMSQAPDGTIYAGVRFANTIAPVAITPGPPASVSPVTIGRPTDLKWVEVSGPPPVPGDLDGDGDVDGDDWTLFMAAFGNSDGDPGYDEDADMDGDGDVDCDDYRLFRQAWRPVRPPTFAPCPGTTHGGPPENGTATGASNELNALLGSKPEANCAPASGAAMTLMLTPLVLCGVRARRRRRQHVDQLE